MFMTVTFFLFADECKIFDSFTKSNLDSNLNQNDLNPITDFFFQMMQMQTSVSEC